jgi:inner membrane protein
MAWWTWILIGLALLAAETLAPGGFFVFFFGLSAVVVGLFAWVGAVGPAPLQWLLFSSLSVAFLLLLRPRLVGRFEASGSERGNAALPDLVGDVAVLVEDLEPGAVAKAELRGTSWTVRSRASRHVPKGSRCAVERVDGLTLWIVPADGGSGHA